MDIDEIRLIDLPLSAEFSPFSHDYDANRLNLVVSEDRVIRAGFFEGSHMSRVSRLTEPGHDGLGALPCQRYDRNSPVHSTREKGLDGPEFTRPCP